MKIYLIVGKSKSGKTTFGNILREEKKAVAEKEKRENSEKNKEGLGSEKEEGNWDDVFAVRSNSLNFDDRSMERVRRHPCLEGTMCQGKEKFRGKGRKRLTKKNRKIRRKAKGVRRKRKKIGTMFSKKKSRKIRKRAQKAWGWKKTKRI